VSRTAAGILGSADAAEDVAQQVFIKVWQKLPTVRASSFDSWLYRITVNAAIDTLRRQPAAEPLSAQIASLARSPEESTVQFSEQERVRAAVAQLPERTRAALILREYEGLSYKEIATMLEIPVGTVMSRLHYARKILRESLEQ